MKILRLSLFKLKKNKREAIAIAFLTMITTLMLAVFMMDSAKIESSFAASFAKSGSPRYLVMVRGDKYRDEYRTILEDTPGVHDIIEDEIAAAMGTDVRRNGEILSYSLTFVTEKTERKIETFSKGNRLTDGEIEKLAHPIWLPAYFELSEHYGVGDTLTVLIDGIDYVFDIAGFYDTGLCGVNNYTLKCIVSDADYSILGMMLNGETSGIYTGLWFECDEDMDLNGYIQKCSESSSENVKENSWVISYELEKSNTLQFLNVFMYFLAFASGVTMLSALFMIVHRVSNDIEDQMQKIGILEALGYRAWEISLSYTGEYFISGGIGALIGAVLALFADPFMDMGIEGMMGRAVTASPHYGMVFIAAFLVASVVVIIALINTAQVKKLPPVVAFRRGIKAHHFGRNIFPLDKTKGNIDLILALKSFFGDLRSSVGVAACVILSGVAIFFCANFFDFFKDGIDGLMGLSGVDNTITVELVSGVDPYTMKEGISKIPGVRKALISYGGILDSYVSVKGSDERAMMTVYDDYRDSENIKLLEGRFPEQDNEVLITVKRQKMEDIGIGDSIVLEGYGVEAKYVITGVTSSLINNGVGVYLTTDGYLRTMFNDRPSAVSVYLEDGVTQERFEQELTARYGKSIKDILNEEPAGETLEEQIHSLAEQKLAVLINYYGITNADYAIVSDDEFITGNSSGLLIKDVTSFMGMAKQQMGPIADVTKAVSIVMMVIISVVVAAILGLIVSSTVKRQRKSLGIMKGLGYSSKDLMTQLALKTMPITVVSVITGALLTKYLYSIFWLSAFGVMGTVNISVTIAASAVLIVFCYMVTYICAGRVKAISVTELMTE